MIQCVEGQFRPRHIPDKMNSTDNPAEVGKHRFEVAGLGLAPFRFIGVSENVITYPDGTQQAGGSCDYCGTGIRYECHVESRDGKRFKTGCDCIAKVGDAGLLKAYKSSPEYRIHQRELTYRRNEVIRVTLLADIAANTAKLATMPHPAGYADRKTGKPLTALDWAQWYMQNSGAAGRRWLAGALKRLLATGSTLKCAVIA